MFKSWSYLRNVGCLPEKISLNPWCAALTGTMIITDVLSVIFELYAPLSHILQPTPSPYTSVGWLSMSIAEIHLAHKNGITGFQCRYHCTSTYLMKSIWLTEGLGSCVACCPTTSATAYRKLGNIASLTQSYRLQKLAYWIGKMRKEKSIKDFGKKQGKWIPIQVWTGGGCQNFKTVSTHRWQSC